MAKQPWEEKVVDDNEIRISRKTKGSVISTPLLTALLSVFFVIVVAILFVVFYTSNRGGDKASETSNFYGASSSVVSSSEATSSESASSEAPSTDDSSSDTTESSSESNGDTITVMSGEGAASIAARAGISVDKLYELNPDHMTSGYWYANPGDEVHIN
ncbi:LysM domain-containing protein [Streptococcus equinus]|uniref:LysM domain-containing protein n=1 Tax=Streptococcus equinus TaxID=1335 RepID=A0A1H0KBS5_STREI|nr:SAG1386/EF1546 family surface-associated protein [Streptococcus equinus]SDO53273.1 LysM domain-containing protein [Streptococcus equinus]